MQSSLVSKIVFYGCMYGKNLVQGKLPQNYLVDPVNYLVDHVNYLVDHVKDLLFTSYLFISQMF